MEYLQLSTSPITRLNYMLKILKTRCNLINLNTI